LGKRNGGHWELFKLFGAKGDNLLDQFRGETLRGTTGETPNPEGKIRDPLGPGKATCGTRRVKPEGELGAQEK